jgi:methionyl-tRNA formyltransferase
VRAFHPRPACTTFLPAGPLKGGSLPLQPGPLLKVLRAEVAAGVHTRQPPGTVVSMQDCPVIAAGDGCAVRLLEVRTEGRPRAISGQEFVNGYRQRVRVGERFFPGMTLAVEQCG